MPEEKKRTKVIYIAGMGHSGSTLLDFLLGNMPGVFSTGENVNLFFQIYRSQQGINLPEKVKKKINRYIRINYKNTHCSCLREFSDCAVWSKVVDALSRKIGYDIWKDPLRYRIYYPPLGTTPPSFYLFGKVQRKLTTLSHTYKPLSAFGDIISILSRKITDNNWRLFDTIREQTGRDFIVDSSKDIHRFHYLYQQRPDDMYLIILVRNIQGVAASYKKLNRDPLRTSKKWLNEYRKIDIFTRNKKGLRAIVINYDHLAGHMESELKKVHRFLGIPFDGYNRLLNTENHHLVGGNKIRYSGNIRVKKDESWKTVLSPGEISSITMYNRQNPFFEMDRPAPKDRHEKPLTESPK